MRRDTHAGDRRGEQPDTCPDDSLAEYLSRFVTEERLARILQVLSERTRYLTVVLEDIYQPHNASAVLRTCDAFGIQDVHVIENRNTYEINRNVELGTAQWLTLRRYRDAASNTETAVSELRAAGYRIVATSPHARQQSLEQFDLDAGPAAILFGTEKEGLSQTALSLADELVSIPMYGFVESFNISVSAALVLHQLTGRLRESGIDYSLSPRERAELYLHWLRGSISRVDALEREYRDREAGGG